MLIISISGESISQGRNWRHQEWGWNQNIPPVSVIDVATPSIEGNVLMIMNYS